MGNQRQSTFTWICAAGAVLLMLITIFAVAFAVEEHNDRVLADEITGTASDLQETGARIMDIRDADMNDMNEYIRAFSQMEPLLNDYDRDLQRYTDLYNQARDRERSLFSVERLYRRPHLTNSNMSEILDIMRTLNKVIKQEMAVVQSMAALPQSERMQFWHEHFLPLEAEEKGLRARLLIVGQRMSPAEQ